MSDVIIEPQRSKFVPDFYKIKDAATEAGALGVSFSGSGPSMFAFTRTREEAQKVSYAMRLPLQKEKISSDCWISPIGKKAAHVV